MTGQMRGGWWWRATAAGVALGAANSLSSALGSPYGDWSLSDDGIFPLEVLAAMLGSEWAWCLAGFAVGFWTVGARSEGPQPPVRHRLLRGALAGALALVAANVAYYVSDALLDVERFSPHEFAF